MDNLPYAEGFKEIDLPADQLKYLGKDETGICPVSIGLMSTLDPEISRKIKLVSVDGIDPTEENIRNHRYLIARPLTLATKGAPKGNVREFIGFMLSKDGQVFVAKNFVPVRSLK